MEPSIASGVPAAMPHAPATMITEMVERILWVTRKVRTAAAQGKINEVTCKPVGDSLNRRARLLCRLDGLDDLPKCGIATQTLDADFKRPD